MGAHLNLHKSSCRDFIMSIQEWKNHQTYLIFPHVLEVCFLEKARKNPKWVKRNVVKDFPQQNLWPDEMVNDDISKKDDKDSMKGISFWIIMLMPFVAAIIG